MRPLRVLHIIESLGRGGAERQLVNQLLAHDRRLIHPSVIALNQPLDLAAELRAAGIAVLALDLPTFRDLPLATLQLIGIIKLLRPNIVHTWLTRADIAGRIAAVISGKIPVVSAVQAPIYEPSVFLENPRQKKWKLHCVRGLDLLTGWGSKTLYVACSQAVGASIQRALRVAPQRTQVIYNGVNLGEAQPYRPGQRLISVGRLSPEKGQRYLIEAMPQVLAHYPEATLDIVGAGPLRDRLQSQIQQLGLHNAVTLLGLRSDVPQLLQQSSLFVFPSLWEGLGVVVLEALAAGLPTIASAIPVLHEIIDHDVHGLLVPAQDPAALAEAIITLLDRPAYAQQLGAAGRQRIAESFDINVTARQWEQLYIEQVKQND